MMSHPTAELLQLLRRHYIKPGALPGGVFVAECGINGSHRQSRADAIYVGFTSASGRLLVGHEIKVSRADWRKELDTAGKADFWADNCHAWYIVAPGPEIVPAEEIPHGWGLMYPSTRSKTRMAVVVKPTVHTDRTPAWSAVRSILARLDTLRAQHDEQVRRDALETARKQAATELEHRYGDRTLTPEQRTRLAVLEQLEDLIGVKIEGWVRDDEAGKVDVATAAAAIRLIRTTQGLGVDRTPRYAIDALQSAGEKLLAGLAAYGEASAELAALLERR